MNTSLTKNENLNAIDSFINIIKNIYQGNNAALDTLLIKDNFQPIIDIVTSSEGVLKSATDIVSELRLLKEVIDIPTKLFMRKFERYCRGLTEIPIEKRAYYLKKVGKKSFNQDSIFILEVLNKIEESEKIDIMLSLLKAKFDEIIDDVTYRRLMLMTSHTLYNDLCYLENDIKNDNFTITSIEQEGLLGNGWIRPLGPGFIHDDATERQNLFAYNKIAKSFCRIVFNSTIEEIPPNDNGIIQLTTDEDIEQLFT